MSQLTLFRSRIMPGRERGSCCFIVEESARETSFSRVLVSVEGTSFLCISSSSSPSRATLNHHLLLHAQRRLLSSSAYSPSSLKSALLVGQPMTSPSLSESEGLGMTAVTSEKASIREERKEKARRSEEGAKRKGATNRGNERGPPPDARSCRCSAHSGPYPSVPITRQRQGGEERSSSAQRTCKIL